MNIISVPKQLVSINPSSLKELHTGFSGALEEKIGLDAISKKVNLNNYNIYYCNFTDIEETKKIVIFYSSIMSTKIKDFTQDKSLFLRRKEVSFETSYEENIESRILYTDDNSYIVFPVGKVDVSVKTQEFSQTIIVCISKDKTVTDFFNTVNECEFNKQISVFDIATEGNHDQTIIRNMDTVYISKIIKDKVIGKITKFFKPEIIDIYKKNGISHSLKFLFYGLPGTGKTTFVKALATYFNKNVYIVTPQTMGIISSIKKASFVLIEDFDTAFTEMMGSRHSESPHERQADILNILDGFIPLNNIVLFITCNDTKILQSPFLRSGRIDEIIHFDVMESDQIYSMISNFYPVTTEEEKSNLTAFCKANNRKFVCSDLQDAITHFLLEENLTGFLQKGSKYIFDKLQSRYSTEEINKKSKEHYYSTIYKAGALPDSIYSGFRPPGYM